MHFKLIGNSSSLKDPSFFHNCDGVWRFDLNQHIFLQLCLHFLLSFSFDGEDISNTQMYFLLSSCYLKIWSIMFFHCIPRDTAFLLLSTRNTVSI